ncbi:hypothetical protein NDU88_006603 [Pleurodeles waltl]|uniref:Uncharacterized protein n=1 Tax=Pleurodeles waltl TaxID=8319 RepID=A0AAV7L4L4_PLEWA|nr:hypothetical protein NDU88_006603 [Pleurodeles waltl]
MRRSRNLVPWARLRDGKGTARAQVEVGRGEGLRAAAGPGRTLDRGRRSEPRLPHAPSKRAVAGEQGPRRGTWLVPSTGQEISWPPGESSGDYADPAGDQGVPHRVKGAAAGPCLPSGGADLMRPGGGCGWKGQRPPQERVRRGQTHSGHRGDTTGRRSSQMDFWHTAATVTNRRGS